MMLFRVLDQVTSNAELDLTDFALEVFRFFMNQLHVQPGRNFIEFQRAVS